MPAYRYHSSAAPHCVSPRAHTDASQRFQKHGPIVPMDEDADTTPTLSRIGLAVVLIAAAGMWFVGG